MFSYIFVYLQIIGVLICPIILIIAFDILYVNIFAVSIKIKKNNIKEKILSYFFLALALILICNLVNKNATLKLDNNRKNNLTINIARIFGYQKINANHLNQLDQYYALMRGYTLDDSYKYEDEWVDTLVENNSTIDNNKTTNYMDCVMIILDENERKENYSESYKKILKRHLKAKEILIERKSKYISYDFINVIRSNFDKTKKDIETLYLYVSASPKINELIYKSLILEKHNINIIVYDFYNIEKGEIKIKND